jgi:hypothetical protein
MKLHFKNTIILFIAAILLSGCATYHITTESLLEQLADTQKEKKIIILVSFPFFFPFMVSGNNLQFINCLDKNGKERVLRVTNRTGIRITKMNGERNTFYFNTLLVKDSLITGKKDHFIGVNIKPINLNNIQKIELQR